ncbi:hypothetical protein GTP41_21440 [Pseudoduganella sp. DS3]|uniref:Uncharacterized protein n=1 Tax=Pseudoduganella guangdongensis TaxID=2692179 RepID=A0A6N9HPD3_9BURK|nr:hypothetical protein [Pseudoduganella guangdongensis]
MRLPGTRYQEHGWEQVRKLLGHCSLQAFRQCDADLLLDPSRAAESLEWYADAAGRLLRDHARRARGEAPGNSYGDSAAELALVLLYELQAQTADWAAFLGALAAEHARSGAFWREESGQGMLRKKVNDMFAVLRDKVDSDNYQVATGQPCSPNKIYTYRMLDTAYREIAQLFANWEHNAVQVGAILGRELHGFPIEVRQMRCVADCRAEWLIRWSETLEQFGGAPGPLHTRSKRFASMKNNPGKIAAMLREIGDYEELSSNQDGDWQLDEAESLSWMEDLWRVADEAQKVAEAEVCPSPRKAGLAALQGEALPVRLAVFQVLLGPADDSYPEEWLEPGSGELPSMARLAEMAGISVPTLRKRRNELIEKLKYGLNAEAGSTR